MAPNWKIKKVGLSGSSGRALDKHGSMCQESKLASLMSTKALIEVCRDLTRKDSIKICRSQVINYNTDRIPWMVR